MVRPDRLCGYTRGRINMTKRILRRLMVAVVGALWALPGSGCLPADEAGSTLVGLLHGQPNTDTYVWDVG